jgi:CHAT domain
MTIRILFLPAHPSYSQRIQDIKKIFEDILKGNPDKFQLITKDAIPIEKAIMILSKIKPDIIHFSGLESTEGGLIFRGSGRSFQKISPDRLDLLFGALEGNIRCVLLDACYDKYQADAISRYVDCVIGMPSALIDPVRTNYAASFYQALSHDKSIEEAVSFANISLSAYNINISDSSRPETPKIRYRPDMDRSLIMSLNKKADLPDQYILKASNPLTIGNYPTTGTRAGEGTDVTRDTTIEISKTSKDLKERGMIKDTAKTIDETVAAANEAAESFRQTVEDMKEAETAIESSSEVRTIKLKEDVTEYAGHEVKKSTEYTGHEVKKSTEYTGHEVKESTEYAGHEVKESTEYAGHEVKESTEYADITKAWEEAANDIHLESGILPPPNGHAEDQILKRYPSATFPMRVILGKPECLKVMIQSTSPKPGAKPIFPKIKADKKEVLIDLIIDPGTFEIADGDRFRTIRLAIESESSDRAEFFLKAAEIGLQEIKIRFYQEGTYLGKLLVSTFVISKEVGADVSEPHITIADWQFPKIRQGPDITLYIIEQKKLVYDIRLSSYEFPLKKFGPLPFPFDPEEQVRSIFADIENTTKKPADQIDDDVKSKGLTFYNKLFPDNLKDFYWGKKDKIKSMRVFSDEPWIPWEILKPNKKLADGKTQEEKFLCEKHSFSRWVADESDDRINEYRQFKKIKIIVPWDTDLEYAKNERDWIMNKFGKDHGLDVSLADTYKKVIDTLENGDYDILHFSTHGRYDTKNPLSSALKMERGHEIRVERIAGEATNFGNSTPLIIMNACLSGTQGYSLIGIDGWAASFIKAGACAFIGTMWSVNDKIAFGFTQNLYREMAKGQTLGEAVKLSRNNCKLEGNPSWLAYQLYAHPNATVKIANPVSQNILS